MLPLEKCLELKAAGIEQLGTARVFARVHHEKETLDGIETHRMTVSVPRQSTQYSEMQCPECGKEIVVTRLWDSHIECADYSGDELIAECLPLLKEGETVSVTVGVDTRARVAIYGDTPDGVVLRYPQPLIEPKTYATLQEALADLWLWLNERKKRND